MSTSTTTRLPVRWDGELNSFVVSGFAEADALLRNQGWSSDLRLNPNAAPDLKELPIGNLLTSDPPDHTRLRRAIGPAFTPAQIGRLRPRVAAIVEATLDGLAEIGPQVEILADLGQAVSLAVICELFDVGSEGAQLFSEQTPNLMRGVELSATLDDLTAGAAANAELMLFLTPLLAERRIRPGEDFISALLAVDELELHEVMSTALLLLLAGHLTTANLIANSTLALLENPEQIPHLHADPGRAVEELLRCHGPVRYVARTALLDHELGGTHIGAGQAVLIDIRAANRDARRFVASERMDLTREPPGHLAFGAGIHFCLGAALARLETSETLTRLLSRYPRLARTSQPLHWRESSVIHGLRQLDVDLGWPLQGTSATEPDRRARQ